MASIVYVVSLYFNNGVVNDTEIITVYDDYDLMVSKHGEPDVYQVMHNFKGEKFRFDSFNLNENTYGW